MATTKATYAARGDVMGRPKGSKNKKKCYAMSCEICGYIEFKSMAAQVIKSQDCQRKKHEYWMPLGVVESVK